MKFQMRAGVGVLVVLMLGACASTQEKKEVADAAMNPLLGTFWRLTMIGDRVIPTPGGTRAVHIVLEPQNQAVAGFSGCNRMFGHYSLNASSIKFSEMGGTRMFCENTQDLENEFLATFANVSRWRITGQTLELQDADGKPLTTFATMPTPPNVP